MPINYNKNQNLASNPQESQTLSTPTFTAPAANVATAPGAGSGSPPIVDKPANEQPTAPTTMQKVKEWAMANKNMLMLAVVMIIAIIIYWKYFRK